MNKILSIKNTSAIFLATILVLGTISTISPSFLVGVQADSYYGGMDTSYNSYESPQYPLYKPDYKAKYSSDNNNDKTKDSKSVSINKLKCINTNLNINGNNTGDVNIGNKGQGYSGANSYGGGYYDGYVKKQGKSFDCIINNNNTNTNIGGGGGNQTIPPVPPTPPEPPIRASLTVNKEIFGCDNIFIDTVTSEMQCRNLPPDSPDWISCDDPAISNTSFCQALTENIFDIEVLDDENNQIAQFEGSAEGETIENLEPGTYTVNEIVVSASFPTLFDQLHAGEFYEPYCTLRGFDGGGILFLNDGTYAYEICFEYEDEQGNDCSTITLAEGEARTCTVKNYITFGRSPTIAQGTEEDLSALGKTTKLKQQWLDLLP